MAERNTVDMGGGCGIPLVASDLAAYDTTPDGMLYLNEFPAGRFDCLADRYLHTDDKEVRIRFLNAMSNGVWEAMQTRFQTVAKEGRLEAALQDRLTTILDREFPTRELRWNVGTEWDHTEESEDSSVYSAGKATDTLLTYGAITALLPFGRWKWVGNLRGDFGTNSERQSTVEEGASSSTDYFYVHVKLTPKSEFLTRDDRFIITADAAWAHYFDPPPDHLVDDLNVKGSVKVLEIPVVGHPLSLEGGVNYLNNAARPPPPESGFFTIRTDTLTVNGRTTYGLADIGLLLDYTFVQDDSAQHYVEKASAAHQASALFQYSANGNSYVRVGAGGGARTSRYTLVDRSPTTGDSASAHVRMEGQIQLHPIVRLQGSGRITAEKGDGTFVGWYPGWSASLILYLSPPHWTISLAGTYDGSTIDLNETQRTHNVTINGEVVYCPVDWVKFSTKGEFVAENVAEYDAHTFRKGKVTGVVAINIPAWKPLWVGGYGGGVVYDYDGEGLRVEGSGWWTGFFVDITQ